MKSLRLSAAVGVCLLLAAFGAYGAGTVATPHPGEMNAHFINVGQGSSVLLEFSCGAALIDTGGEKNDSFDGPESLKTYLDRFFQRRTDLNSTLAMVIISHPHIDHTRGLPLVLGRYTVKTYIDNGQETGSGGRQQKAAHQKSLTSGGALKWQPITQRETLSTGHPATPAAGTLQCPQTIPQFRFLWGALDAQDSWPAETLKNQNDSSVVTRLDFGSTSFLFPGDIEDDVQEDLIDDNCPEGLDHNCILDVDIYHVAHHGSHNGTTLDLVEAMTPRVAMLSMGPWNRREAWTAFKYGHPRVVTMKLLLDALHGGVQDTRPEVSVMIAKRGAARTNSSASASQFTKTTLTKAIYGTGWDGNVVIAAKSNKTWQVVTGVTP